MGSRIAPCILLGILLARPASAAPGILLLADRGTAEWNTSINQLAAAVDKRTPAEAVLWSASPNVQAAVERLVKRGVSEIVAVPLFIAAAPSDLASHVKSSVPLRVAAPLNGDPVLGDIVLARAERISKNSGGEVLVIVSHRAASAADKRWIPDLRAAAVELNRTRRFAAVLTTTLPADSSEASTNDAAKLRSVLERQIAAGRRILVVPMLTPYGGPENAIKQQLHGLAHELAKSTLVPDDRLVAWIVSRAEEK